MQLSQPNKEALCLQPPQSIQYESRKVFRGKLYGKIVIKSRHRYSALKKLANGLDKLAWLVFCSMNNSRQDNLIQRIEFDKYLWTSVL